MKHPGKTPPFRGPRGEAVPGSIAEIKYLQRGDVAQLVMIVERPWSRDDEGTASRCHRVGGRVWTRRSRVRPVVRRLQLVGFGAASSVAIQGIEQNFTPWAGGFERINAYAYFAWLVVLAVTARRSLDQGHRSEK